MKSLLAFALLLVLCSARDDRPTAVIKKQFEFFEKFIEHKDRESASKFISPYFSLVQNCDDHARRKFIGKDEFMRRVFNMASSPNPFHVEVLNATYNPRHQCIDSVQLDLKIHGFGEPLLIKGYWGFDDLQLIDSWNYGRPMNC